MARLKKPVHTAVEILGALRDCWPDDDDGRFSHAFQKVMLELTLTLPDLGVACGRARTKEGKAQVEALLVIGLHLGVRLIDKEEDKLPCAIPRVTPDGRLFLDVFVEKGAYMVDEGKHTAIDRLCRPPLIRDVPIEISREYLDWLGDIHGYAKPPALKRRRQCDTNI